MAIYRLFIYTYIHMMHVLYSMIIYIYIYIYTCIHNIGQSYPVMVYDVVEWISQKHDDTDRS